MVIRVCVIGAGVSGLPSIKACVEEGLDVVCYERTSDIGGLWNYRPDLPNDGGTVMKSTVVNTSKEMMSYSDFPPPEEYPNFMHHSLVMDYYRDYANKFNLLKHIQFNTDVKQVYRNTSGKTWTVELADGKKELFDRLMLCTGHHSIPQYPQFKDFNKFKGRVIHAKEYRDFKGFEDKNVFLVGIGNSALDIAVELTKVAKKVTISTRRGSWIFNRVGQAGMPYDVVFQSRLYYWLMRILPWSVANDFMEHRLQQRMDHDLYGLRPAHRFFQQHPTVNDSLANLLCTGQIVITEDVDSFESNGVIVKNGRRFDADVIILCTGYTFGFPYLTPKNIIPVNDHEVDLYKFVFPPNASDLAVIGLIQPIGSLAPISEIQARWVARVYAGRCSLPSTFTRKADIEYKKKQMQRRYFKSNKHTLQVDFVPYMDEIAEAIGAKPDLQQIFYTDFRFFLRLFLGGNLPYVYRLVGPNSWEGARQAVWEAPLRVKKPLKNRQCKTRRHKRRGTLDEYFRYVSCKWIAFYSVLILCAGLWTFCAGSAAISPLSYFIQVFIFIFIFSFMLLWFDLQYDMSTIF
ncbi:unnamed protein product [Bursaphelenchus okinawaensis]|uniref:Flavin-containing monooxygenase n=1 Tax=Bursaphelenchus okinawaensis TaxID=465554 RepID=A0A811LCK8_9BILA|nr:unnamed protein product [Bursaphelenchus okinawaensis]CAG9120631.1 unnamed protein product [Bursaphelenchus okinawaensis]